MKPRLLTLWLGMALVLAPQLPAQTPETRISVLYFSTTNPQSGYSWLAKGLADSLVTSLGRYRGLTVVEREDLQKVVAEQELALTGLVDETQAPTMGRLLGASHLVYGSYLVRSGKIRVDTKVVNAETGAIVGTHGFESNEAGLFTALDQGAQTLALALGWQGTPGQAAVVPDFATQRTYYQGIDLLDSGDFQGAAGLFAQASRSAPLWTKPGESLELSYQFLKNFRLQRYRREMNQLLADITAIRARIEGQRFYRFADMVMAPLEFGFPSAMEASEAYRARPRIYNGDTPAQAAWFLQTYLGELASMAINYFQDTALAEACYLELIKISDRVSQVSPEDPWLPELVYQKLIALVQLKRWPDVIPVAEYIMTTWPDYRMNYGVEDFYERALGGGR